MLIYSSLGSRFVFGWKRGNWKIIANLVAVHIRNYGYGISYLFFVRLALEN